MIYPDRDSVEWAMKHNLELRSHRCMGCGEPRAVDVPIISKDFVGFESKEHKCGPKYKIILLKPRFDADFDRVVRECGKLIEMMKRNEDE